MVHVRDWIVLGAIAAMLGTAKAAASTASSANFLLMYYLLAMTASRQWGRISCTLRRSRN